MPLLHRKSSLVLILAPYESGKTSLLKYLILDDAENIKGVQIYTKSVKSKYEEDYSFINRHYITDKFDPENIDKLIARARKITHENPNAKFYIVFDDSIGLAKGLFDNDKIKSLITTLRKENITMIVSIHRIQKDVSTLLRGNFSDLFIFKQKDVNGIKILFDDYGESSKNINTYGEFKKSLQQLEKFHFLHYTDETMEWTEHILPNPHTELPDYRLYLDKSDEEAIDGKELIYGNKENYNIKPLEFIEEYNEAEVQDDRQPLFVESDEENELELLEETVDPRSLNSLYDDLIEEDTEKINKIKEIKKRKYEKEEEKEENVEPEVKSQRIDEIARLRALKSLEFTSTSDIFRPQIETVYKNFFDTDFATLPNEELFEQYRKMKSALSLYNCLQYVQKPYQLARTAVKIVCREWFGVEPPQHVLGSMFSEHCERSCLKAIEKLKPEEFSNENTLVNTIMGLIEPSLQTILDAKKTSEFNTALNSVLEENILAEDVY